MLCKIKQIVSHSLSLVALTFWASTSFAQPNDRWQAGSACQLKGEIQSLYCFVETEDSPWTTDVKTEVLSSLTQAQQWIIAQASTWNIPVQFATADLLNGKNLKLPKINSGTGSGQERVDWVSEITKKTGYGNARKAYRKLSKKYKNDNIYLIIFAHADGISYAMRFAKGLSKRKYFLEGILLYQRYDNGTEMPVPAVLAHESLHLYGAWDLYTTYAQTPEKHAKATELYPNDIMLRVNNDLSSLKADKLTAWLIGWNKNKEDIFEWFRPSDFKK